jgi:uncharacterized lipoprotein YmbA
MKPLPVILLILIGLVWGLTSGGCISSSVGKEYYQLYLPTGPGLAGDESAAPQGERVLLVEAVEVESIYNDYRMVYKTSPYHLNYYTYNYWIKKPGVLIRNSLVDYFSARRVFQKVITGLTEGEPDLQLKAMVHILEEYDGPVVWSARLKMDIEIKDFKSGEQVLFHSFDRQKQMKNKTVEQFPVAISMILQEELDKVIDRLVKKE